MISSASASGISTPNSSSIAMTTSTASSESNPRSEVKAAVGDNYGVSDLTPPLSPESRRGHTFPPSTFSNVFMTSMTLLLISSLARPADAAYPRARARAMGAGRITTDGRVAAKVAARSGARRMTDLNIV